MPSTDGDGLGAAFARQRLAFSREPFPTLAARLDRLARLGTLTEKHELELIAAIAADFGARSSQETRLTELFLVTAAVRHARRQLAGWMRPRRVSTPIYLRPGRSRIERQPLGVAGIISPWNYPFQLAMLPAVAALAAGNRVMLKPSELTPRTSELMAKLVEQHFSRDEFAVITGGADIGAAFASLPFDHLFFTGSTGVGREIAKAAAANLTPVTLELGGKSPALVLPGCAPRSLAPRLAAGKFLNAGQTCIAPDYALIPATEVDAWAAALEDAAGALYPSWRDNPDYTSVINDAHRERLSGLVDDARLKGARVVPIGGLRAAATETTRRMAPTLLVGATSEMKVMQQEIFGPLLPIEAYADIDDAIRRINERPRPLAMYVFGGNPQGRRAVLARTHAGGVTENDALWHFCNESLPFGGIGASGSGAYHGEHGFLTFSHQKPVFVQSRAAATWLLYPPFGPRFEAMLRFLKRIA